MRYMSVTVRDRDLVIGKIRAYPPQDLRTILLREKVPLYRGLHRLLNCRGKGLCGTCLVRVVDNPSGLSDMTPREAHMLKTSSPQARLACQAFVCDDLTIDTRKTDLADGDLMAGEAREARIDMGAEHPGAAEATEAVAEA